ncbi:Hint domain-containing protein [Roseinatronobacter sp.]|uniref:Hint domain-containing protein n=1 Tax=Roseinatronobacter sp. TaxID=1945755 RepID=UPI0025CF4440|nr:Hint domain-containing protein [Rhodobaca sp.]
MSLLSSSVEMFSERLNTILDLTSSNSTSRKPALPTSGDTLREVGLLNGTLLATNTGWCPIERVQAYDPVLTFDNGMQSVVQNRAVVIRHAQIPAAKAFTMFIPAGALGNQRDMNILPMQEVVLESDIAEEMFGNAFVLAPCAMLEGYKGIAKHPIMTDISLHMLTFKAEQIVQAEGEVLMLAQSEGCFSPFAETVVEAMSVYPRLTQAQLLRLVEAEKAL